LAGFVFFLGFLTCLLTAFAGRGGFFFFGLGLSPVHRGDAHEKAHQNSEYGAEPMCSVGSGQWKVGFHAVLSLIVPSIGQERVAWA
jgi:hypothetical protein